ncbi:Transcription factor WhiB [Trueperella bialowiezensis]|uniref:Transcriptional regulator WhiB n=2 Tax=Trueperella bialowiezensis TaxID=312285 RepID=A0A3S4VFD5_9ACTO|nr:Transcription factor WhiB [Trueperella bialowiezensis]
MRLSKAASSLQPAGAGEDPKLAQALMEGIFDLGYGFADQGALGWMEHALCAQTDPDIFYPEKGGSTAPATSICKNCAVRAECLEYAVSNDIRHGIWGGTSDNDRKRMARERKAARGGGR